MFFPLLSPNKVQLLEMPGVPRMGPYALEVTCKILAADTESRLQFLYPTPSFQAKAKWSVSTKYTES